MSLASLSPAVRAPHRSRCHSSEPSILGGSGWTQRAFPAIQDAHVRRRAHVSHADSSGGLIGHAAVALAPDHDDLRRHFRMSVPTHKVRNVQSQEAALLGTAIGLRCVIALSLGGERAPVCSVASALQGICRASTGKVVLFTPRPHVVHEAGLRVHPLHHAAIGSLQILRLRWLRLGHLLVREGAPRVGGAAVHGRAHELLLEVPRKVDKHAVPLRMPRVEEAKRRSPQLAIRDPANLRLVDEQDSQRWPRLPRHVGEREGVVGPATRQARPGTARGHRLMPLDIGPRGRGQRQAIPC
mmetsp:Transcript_64830/g.167368  ORF Transcript_64830/g.167368 Transcript_64830/m.167368 type:complete len:298 (+) Transcript_64830:70-963(+)